MVIRVCSGFSPDGRVQYGERFLSTFDARWPKSIELQVYVEEPMAMPREACRSLWDIEGASEFHERHQGNLAAHGLVAQPSWKSRDRAAGYSFRTDAYKFWKQILIPEAASADMADGDILIWLDGDVETTASVPDFLIPKLIGDAQVCYLGRYPKHSEIGFWAVRLDEITRRFIHAIAEMYRTDAVFDLPQWHSAYVWDHVRKRAFMSEHNLTPGGTGHVWPTSPLGRYTRHDKGKRKPGGTR